jgi:hypothetical protein
MAAVRFELSANSPQLSAVLIGRAMIPALAKKKLTAES